MDCKIFQNFFTFLVILIFFCEEPVTSMTKTEKREMKAKVLEAFMHAYKSYMNHAYPADELMPLSCKGRYRGTEPSRGDIDDSLGNFSLTLIDTLDTLVVIGELEEFEKAVKLVIRDVKFDTDIVVSVFEVNIRVVGGLLGAHSMAIFLQRMDKAMQWYNNELLFMAKDVAYRLLPAFNTSTGMPYPRVNLKYGVSQGTSRAGTERDTCTACAGTIILEFAALSRLTGDPVFEAKAKKALNYLWEQRHRQSDLVGTVINIHNGDWIRRESGVGAGIDSYYEYLLKAYILLGDNTYLDRFNKHYTAVMKYINQGPLLVDVHMHRPTMNSRHYMDALLAFWPGLQVLKGDLKPAIEIHEMLFQITQRHKFLPEAFTTDFRVHWAHHPLRPEFIESTYFVYKATGDPYYLNVGKTVLENLNNHARVDCGFAAIKDVSTLQHEDQLDSYVMAETFKYLYLLFAEKEDLVLDVDDYVFTTEAHLLPLSLAMQNGHSNYTHGKVYKPGQSCPSTGAEFPSNLNFAQAIRSPLKNFVEKLCPKPKQRPNEPYHSLKQHSDIPESYEKNTQPSFNQNQQLNSEKINRQNSPNAGFDKIDPRPQRLRANDFIAGNKEQLELLHKMGIKLATMSDGRVQLIHTANEAASTDDAEDGLLFMQEMIELSKIQPASPENNEPRVVQIISQPFFGAVILNGGPAQFGLELKNNAGVQGNLVVAEPYSGCDTLTNKDIQGKIVIMERGTCLFIDKARRIQEAGGIGGIVIDINKGTSSATSLYFAMSGDGKQDVTIPMVFLFELEGEKLLKNLESYPNLAVLLAYKAKDQENVMKELLAKSKMSDSETDAVTIINVGNIKIKFSGMSKLKSSAALRTPPHPSIEVVRNYGEANQSIYFSLIHLWEKYAEALNIFNFIDEVLKLLDSGIEEFRNNEEKLQTIKLMLKNVYNSGELRFDEEFTNDNSGLDNTEHYATENELVDENILEQDDVGSKDQIAEVNDKKLGQSATYSESIDTISDVQQTTDSMEVDGRTTSEPLNDRQSLSETSRSQDTAEEQNQDSDESESYNLDPPDATYDPTKDEL